MSAKDVEQMPSQTALFVALRRAMAYKEYANEKLGPDNLAEIFLPGYFRFFIKFRKVRENTKKKLRGLFPGMTE